MASTPVTEIPKIIEKLRSNFQAGFTHSLSFRKGQLLQILKLVDENREALEAALFADLHRPKYETAINELDDVKHQVNYTLSTFEARTRPVSVHTPLQLRPYGSWSVVPEPYGVALIIAPWNFPFGLLMNPLVGAIAAGNAAVLKPSEVSSTVAKLLGELVPKYLDSRAYRIVLGAVPETTALLEQRFDKICYTGGGGVGRVVAAAAAKHLTPTLLELGGKCPVYVHRSANVRVAARRIMWGKFMNCGQICIAPDYVMADRELAIEYSRRSGKKKQQKTVVAHEPRLEPVQTVRFTPKANVQLVPALSRLHITKHFNTEYRGDCQISVTRQIAGGPTYDRQEMLISLPKSFEAEAVYRGALVHYRYEDTVVIRVERDRALDKAIQRYFEIPEEVAYQLDAACVELIQSFLVGKKA